MENITKGTKVTYKSVEDIVKFYGETEREYAELISGKTGTVVDVTPEGLYIECFASFKDAQVPAEIVEVAK